MSLFSERLSTEEGHLDSSSSYTALRMENGDIHKVYLNTLPYNTKYRFYCNTVQISVSLFSSQTEKGFGDEVCLVRHNDVMAFGPLTV
jgi:hypothetical protein